MQVKYIDGNMLRNMIINAADNLQNNKNTVDDLNVFPVPDGDTGTNMSLTIQYAASEVKKSSEEDLYKVAQIASSGALMGARGNSGVILSQLFRGFAKGCKDKTNLGPSELAFALKDSSDMAYKAVMKPIEGTILTVAREMSEFAIENKDKFEFIDEMILAIIAHGEKSLAKTPDLLPVLKEAGVVDAGGMGLLFIAEGAYEVVSGKSIPKKNYSEVTSERMFEDNIMSLEDITYGYCTEFIILKEDNDISVEESLKLDLSTFGDSVIVVGDENNIKVHVHTDNPDRALKLALNIGALTRIKIDNMREQVANNAIHHTQAVEKEYGFISVASGDGLQKLFMDLGVDEVILGGQTMNPSTQDFMNCIQKINAKEIFILPNNSNILLAANQAKEISDKSIIVIPTKTVPQGITAMLSFNGDIDIQENTATMIDAIEYVKTGQITYAVRDTIYKDLTIKKGDIIGLIDNNIQVVGNDVYKVAIELMEKMVDDESSLISIYYGSDTKQDEVESFFDNIEKQYSDLDVELNYGGQGLYYLIVSVE
ncbi:DAK2 domain-containing protein [Alkalibaculum sp. M08DMB]|uniref:DAK2 domain-containing protein n=1 Tax=Alkalibaculum sporogenes TaxID=2655001 RepID=A0A6A7K9Q7_9FIRM|nr:DAK2 domain-containing protein [Alkalibaculum sporogenes]MPW26041.1 DAK2 domain-containing protein [Alkalibaculum sporogenes]